MGAGTMSLVTAHNILVDPVSGLATRARRILRDLFPKPTTILGGGSWRCALREMRRFPMCLRPKMVPARRPLPFPKVTSNGGSNSTALDGLGRDATQMPDDSWAETISTYTAMSNPATVSTVAPGFTTSYHRYDAFGRPARIVDPEGARTDLYYTGTRLTRSVSRGSGGLSDPDRDPTDPDPLPADSLQSSYLQRSLRSRDGGAGALRPEPANQ